MVNFKEWDGFEGRLWKEEINVRDFIQNNYKIGRASCRERV